MGQAKIAPKPRFPALGDSPPGLGGGSNTTRTD